MRNIIKMQWHEKEVNVMLHLSHFAEAPDKALNLLVKVEDDTLLPSCFKSGHKVRANMDIVCTAGGLPKYINKVLDRAALIEHKRRHKIIRQQLTFKL